MESEQIQHHRIFLTRSDLRVLGITVSNSTLIRWEQNDRFPRRARLGGTTVAWPRDLVMAWCNARIAERDTFVYADF